MHSSTKILLALSLALVVLGTLLLTYSSAVFVQLSLALAMAYMLNPAVSMLERRGMGRVTGILVVFAAALVLGGGFAFFLVTSISGELSRVQLNLPEYAQRLYELTPVTVKSRLGIETADRLWQQLDNLLRQTQSISPDLLRPLLDVVQRAFHSTVSLVLALLGYLIIPVYLFYLLADLPRMQQIQESYVPERHRAAYREKLGEIDRVLSGFIRGQLSVCAILALLYSIGLYAIGIDLAIAIGTLAGIFFIIPYLGTILGIVLSMVMALLKFHDILHPLLCLGWFALVQALEGMVITPRVVGDTVGLHPLVTIVTLLIGGQLFGLLGMLLAVPVTAVLLVFLRSLAGYYRDSAFYRGAS